MDSIRNHNKIAWDKEVESGRNSCIPVSSADVILARQGKFDLLLSPTRAIPQSWIGDVRNKSVLCLASGGGQQAPLLAAAGANVTVIDNSPKQLDQDRMVMIRDNLVMKIIEGDMRDLSMFSDESLDMIVHPVANCYIPDVNPMWKECARTLRSGGVLIAAFDNPICQIMDWGLSDQGICQLRYKLPYADTEQLEKDKYQGLLDSGKTIQFGHLLEDQIGGQLRAGFQLTGLFEDYWGDKNRAVDRHFPAFIITRAVKV